MSDESEGTPTVPQAVIERRAEERVRLRVSVDMESVSSFLGLTKDVSLAGICVVADEQLPVDSLVDLEFQIPPGIHPIEAVGEIRWSRAIDPEQPLFTYGIEFLRLSDADRARLGELLEHHSEVEIVEDDDDR